MRDRDTGGAASASSRSRLKHCSCWSMSRKVDGSSRSSSRGSWARQAASSTRWRSPPLSVDDPPCRNSRQPHRAIARCQPRDPLRTRTSRPRGGSVPSGRAARRRTAVRAHRLGQMADRPRALAPPTRRRAVGRRAEDAVSRRPQAGDQVQERALAGAVAAHQRDELAGATSKRTRSRIARVTAHASRRPSTRRSSVSGRYLRGPRAIVSAASTTRGPGTTRASLVPAWTRPALRRGQQLPLPERLPWSALRASPLLRRVAHVARVDDDVGRKADHGLHRDPWVLGEASSASTFTPPAMSGDRFR